MNRLRHNWFITGVALWFVCFVSERSAAQEKVDVDYTDFAVEELLDVEITSVSRKKEWLSQTASAVSVLTREDIRRSGATCIPEALRMVPGLQVARINSSQWAVSSRGFNDRSSGHLLVMIDGRTVYTPIFSGVFWDEKHVVLEDVERIEVIRGPGASVWGANAVNGVINIITRHAKDTLGGVLIAGGGNHERQFETVRYGAQLGDAAWYRLYGTYFDRGDNVDAAGHDTSDDWNIAQAGARIDWQPRPDDLVSWHADYYEGRSAIGFYPEQFIHDPAISYPLRPENDVRGLNITGRWQHAFSESSEMITMLYYDRTERRDDIAGKTIVNTYDIDFQHRFLFLDHHEIIWGLGYRSVADELDVNPIVMQFYPENDEYDLFSAFVQNEIVLVPDCLRLIAGSKFEHNDFSGYEIQPTLRLSYTPGSRHTLWLAFSRAVRTPTRAEQDLVLNAAYFRGSGKIPVTVRIVGNDDFDASRVLAWELGYRFRPAVNLLFDLALFHNDYDDHDTSQRDSLFLDAGRVILQSRFSNKARAQLYGLEMGAAWKLKRWWDVRGSMSYLHTDFERMGSHSDVDNPSDKYTSPRYQMSVQSRMDLPGGIEFDLLLYYVDNLTSGNIPSYVRLDARIGWHLMAGLEFSLALQNLLDDRHPEFDNTNFGLERTEVERSIYAKISWRF
ncbi:MAG: TonB-dependent receptor [Deltaproteobacteria bacterium]|nr:TonB-dependent receptor [Deltaproteobacteria bacterium]